MDPLTALRKYTIRNALHEIILDGDFYIFGNEFKFHRNIETAYRSRNGFYTLDSLLLFARNIKSRHRDYMMQASAAKLQVVTFTDKKRVQDYLEGAVDTTDAIDPAALLPVPGSLLTQGIMNVPEARQDFRNVGSNKRRIISSDLGPGKVEKASEMRKMTKTEEMEWIMARERPMPSRDEMMLCGESEDLFSFAYDLVVEKISQQNEARKKLKEAEEKSGTAPGSTGKKGREPGTSDKSNNVIASQSKTPIILVPKAASALINIFNVREFLENGKFVQATDSATKHSEKPNFVAFSRRIGRPNKSVTYHVYDDPSLLQTPDWTRVVAVFVLGKEWQFKGWPFKDFVDALSRIYGVHAMYDDSSQESLGKVNNWNVRLIPLSRNKRHTDMAAAINFWKNLDTFLGARSCKIDF